MSEFVDRVKGENGRVAYELKQELDEASTSSKNTCILAVYPGCGSTYLWENQKTMEFKSVGENIHPTFSKIKINPWEVHIDYTKFMNDILSEVGKVDFVLIPIDSVLIACLNAGNIPFVLVLPEVFKSGSKDQLLMKQQWLGRLLLKEYKSLGDIQGWVDSQLQKFDTYVYDEFLDDSNPMTWFTLKCNQYISDLIGDLYWRKETYTSRYCVKKLTT